MDNKHVDLEKGTVTLQKGEETKSYSLKSEEDLTALVKQAQVGWNFKATQEQELGELRQTVKNWDNAIAAARNDEKAMGELVQKLEILVGRPLSRQEKKNLDEPKAKILFDEEENSNLNSTLDSLNGKIAQLEKALESEKSRRVSDTLDIEAAKLEKQYDGADGTPKFDRQEIFKFCSEKGISDLELGFKMLHFDKLTEAAKKDAITDLQKQQKELDQRRKGSFVESDGEPGEVVVNDRPTNIKNYRQLGKYALSEMQSKGNFSLFTNDD